MTIVVSSSLSSDSKSRVLAEEARRVLEEDGQQVTFVDLREYPLPLCDAEAAYAHPNVARLHELFRGATSIIVATPIYNYDGTAALKNLIEIVGSAWENKVVGFLCAAGGMSSYMSIMSVANSLMLDFRSVIVPRFVYATGAAFTDRRIVDDDLLKRVAQLSRETSRMGRVLASHNDDLNTTEAAA